MAPPTRGLAAGVRTRVLDKIALLRWHPSATARIVHAFAKHWPAIHGHAALNVRFSTLGEYTHVPRAETHVFIGVVLVGRQQVLDRSRDPDGGRFPGPVVDEADPSSVPGGGPGDGDAGRFRPPCAFGWRDQPVEEGGREVGVRYRADVGDATLAVLTGGDRGPPSEVWVVVAGEDLRMGGL